MDHKVDVCEVTFCNSISVSEHVVMQMLALVRNYIPSCASAPSQIARQYIVSPLSEPATRARPPHSDRKWPTQLSGHRFTVRDHRFSGRRTRKRLCRCSFWVAAPDTRHWKPSLYPTQTAQRKFSLNRVRRRHGPFPPRRPLTGLAGSTRWRCTFREASTCSSSLAGSIPPAAIAQRRGLQPSYEELP